MARMAWHGKSNNIFQVSSYLAEAWALWEPIFGLCYDFQGGCQSTWDSTSEIWILVQKSNLWLKS